MGLEDRDKFYSGLTSTVPNTVSRNAKVGDRSFVGVVAESGKPILDAEVNLRGDYLKHLDAVIRRNETPSGWMRPPAANREPQDDYILGTVPANFSPIGAEDGGFPASAIAADGTLIDAVMLPRIEALVAGLPVTVEYTNTKADGYNLIELQPARVYDGTSATFKRTDLVYLEAWFALVAPSPRASAEVQVVDASTLVGSTIDINGNTLTAVAGAPGVDEFQVDTGSEANTATNIANAINDGGNSFSGDVLAVASVDTVVIRSQERGTGTAVPATGNFITLSVTPSVAGNIVASSATLTGGADRPNKPASAQDKIFRHGNVQSHEDTWLDDELVDPNLDFETSQRIQLQYRIRTTGTTEGLNFKTHPDGFSNSTPPLAQGGESAPVADYPFVPADNASTRLNSDAEAYGVIDHGLWVAGDGSETAAQDLQTLDGFVYAVPLCVVFRHNNVSDAGAGFKGFDPLNNANGAPTYEHTGYTGPVGTIPAGASDRPDGEYVDVIERHHILDLRRHISLTGFDYGSQLQSQVQFLMDGELQTWAIDTADKQTLGGDSGDVGTRHLVANEIGRGSTGTLGGSPPVSGDTDRGVFVRNFDHFARRFGDQPVVERVVIAFYPGDRPDAVSQGDPATYANGTVNPGKYVVKTGGGSPVSEENWFEGDTLVLDLSNLDVTTLGGIFQGLDGGGSSGAGLTDPSFVQYAPAGTRVTDVLSVYHDDGHYFLVGAGSTAVPQEVQPSLIQGLGTTVVEITLDGNDTRASGGLPLSVLSITITAPGTGYSPGDTITLSAPDIAGGVQATAEVDTVGGSGEVTAVLITNPGSGYTSPPTVTFGGGGVGATGTAVIQEEYRMVGGLDSGGSPVVDGSPRRIFVEFEITYPLGVGLTDTPDLTLTPDDTVYDGSGAGPGPVLENATSQRPSDFEAILAPKFRDGFRESTLEYVANDTVSQTPGDERTGTPVGGVDAETVVSRSPSTLVFPRRVYGASSGFFANTTTVRDGTVSVGALRVVDESATEFGSSSRLVVLDTSGGGAVPLSGPGQTLAEIEYFAQDPIPNFGPDGSGYQVTVYYRSNAPQTAGTKDSDITSTGSGVLPTTLNVEPLFVSPNIWTGLTGMGSVDLGYPYVRPLDQIAVNDGTPLTGGSPNQIAGTIKEWYFAASSSVSVSDFDATTGLLALHPFVQLDTTGTLSFGGVTNDQKPRKDAEFRAYYPFTDDTSYRPTVLSQPLAGAARHKVFVPLLAKITEDVTGVSGGCLFRKGEIVLIVISRFAEVDDENNVRFVSPVGGNRTCAAVYKTRNLLLVVPD